MSAVLQVGAPLDDSMGATLVGMIVAAVIHGICLQQAFFYLTTFKKDHGLLKGIVIACCLFDATFIGLVSHAMYHYLISFFGVREEILKPTRTSLLIVLFGGLNACLVQSFYAYRVWILSRGNRILTGLISTMILANFVITIIWVVRSMYITTFMDMLSLGPLSIATNAMAAAIDVLITGTLVTLLNMSRTGMQRSEFLINKLIVFVVSTGALTSACAIAALIAMFASPLSLIYVAFYYCLGRLYTNSLLAALNVRSQLNNSAFPTEIGFTVPSRVLRTQQNSKMELQDISIRVDTTHESESVTVVNMGQEKSQRRL